MSCSQNLLRCVAVAATASGGETIALHVATMQARGGDFSAADEARGGLAQVVVVGDGVEGRVEATGEFVEGGKRRVCHGVGSLS